MWLIINLNILPAGDGGKARIPALSTTNEDGTHNLAETNEEKSKVLARTFFPPKPSPPSTPIQHTYPKRIPYKFHLSSDQLRRQVNKLRLYKAPGTDGIPNVVLKETIDIIKEYLLQIYQAVFALKTYSGHWTSWTTVVLHKPGKPNYSIPKAL